MDKENLTSNSVDNGQATAQVEQVDLKPHYPEKKENMHAQKMSLNYEV